ncbi:MAG: glucose-6-phosphate isomerase [Oscillospiraceae bacterium]|jgi:glucose-6-phosphate isomerase|nr:glucose-6-phosphate isomerase [Oscillospiraceae bacterium]
MKLDLSGISSFISQAALEPWLSKAQTALETLKKGSGAGGEMTGWESIAALKPAVQDCKTYAERLSEISDAVLVVGIGGSYLGAKAVYEIFAPPDKKCEPIFVGNTLSGAYYERVIKSLEKRDFSVIVISKSGTTTEPAVAFRIFEQLLVKRYGASEASKRIIAVTNPGGGALRKICESKNYPMLTIPDSVGGRYSIFTPAGLLPLAVAGIDIDALINGAERSSELNSELAVQYAAARQALYNSGKKIEVVSAWEPNFRWLGEWYKQLFGESEGKDGKGIFPVSLELTADLHSMGQYMQDGERTVFETFLWAESASSITVPSAEDNFDGFNNIAGRKLDEVNRVALDATKAAHIEGGVPAIEIEIGHLCANNIGELLYFFMLTCGISGYISGVNPFDQPGVEAYKKKMKQLL